VIATAKTALFGLVIAILACDGGDLSADVKVPAPAPAPVPAPVPAAPQPTPPVAGDDEIGYVDEPGELRVDPTLAAKAKVLWDTRCAACHGQYGAGGPPGVEPRPRDFHERKWQREAADEHIKKIILEGGLPHGLSPAMGANLDLRGKPELLDQLVVILRGLPHWKPAPPPQP
jgi:mono/diheme cytochrome c family protein